MLVNRVYGKSSQPIFTKFSETLAHLMKLCIFNDTVNDAEYVVYILLLLLQAIRHYNYIFNYFVVVGS